ncbi:MAG TPA: hypothetical protein VGN98_03185, partial [Tianweitania sediminis]|nr:hypothetical protein [Tianweitania sediminis]
MFLWWKSSANLRIKLLLALIGTAVFVLAVYHHHPIGGTALIIIVGAGFYLVAFLLASETSQGQLASYREMITSG